MMFGRNVQKKREVARVSRGPVFSQSLIEALENRQMLSGSVVYEAIHHVAHHATAKHAGLKHHTAKIDKVATTSSVASATTTTSTGATISGDEPLFGPGGIVDTVTFSEAPTAVQKGLTALAATDSLTAPTSTQTVYLGNSNGVETYTLDYTSSGTTTQITVDSAGNTVTPPTTTTTTWATLSGSGTGSDSAAATEINAIATALGLAAPTATTVVYASTPTAGETIYTVHLDSSSTSSTQGYPGRNNGTISVDANGNPVGDQDLPFSVVPTAVQTGFNANLPSGATALATSSTQNVKVRTLDGITLYSTTFTSSGTSTTVTVNFTGALTSLPTDTIESFSDLSVTVQDELQTLATADGVTGTISASQSVSVYKEANGTTIYSVTVSGTNSSSQTVSMTISVDQNGNPTVPPRGGGGDGGGCGGGGTAFGDGGDALLTGGWGGAGLSAVDSGFLFGSDGR